jgi:hypothetical protein
MRTAARFSAAECHSRTIRGVDVGAGPNQQIGRLLVAAIDGPVQSGRAIHLWTVDIGTLANETRERGGVAPHHSVSNVAARGRHRNNQAENTRAIVMRCERGILDWNPGRMFEASLTEHAIDRCDSNMISHIEPAKGSAPLHHCGALGWVASASWCAARA